MDKESTTFKKIYSSQTSKNVLPGASAQKYFCQFGPWVIFRVVAVFVILLFYIFGRIYYDLSKDSSAAVFEKESPPGQLTSFLDELSLKQANGNSLSRGKRQIVENLRNIPGVGLMLGQFGREPEKTGKKTESKPKTPTLAMLFNPNLGDKPEKKKKSKSEAQSKKKQSEESEEPETVKSKQKKGKQPTSPKRPTAKQQDDASKVEKDGKKDDETAFSESHTGLRGQDPQKKQDEPIQLQKSNKYPDGYYSPQAYRLPDTSHQHQDRDGLLQQASRQVNQKHADENQKLRMAKIENEIKDESDNMKKYQEDADMKQLENSQPRLNMDTPPIKDEILPDVTAKPAGLNRRKDGENPLSRTAEKALATKNIDKDELKIAPSLDTGHFKDKLHGNGEIPVPGKDVVEQYKRGRKTNFIDTTTTTVHPEMDDRVGSHELDDVDDTPPPKAVFDGDNKGQKLTKMSSSSTAKPTPKTTTSTTTPAPPEIQTRRRRTRPPAAPPSQPEQTVPREAEPAKKVPTSAAPTRRRRTTASLKQNTNEDTPEEKPKSPPKSQKDEVEAGNAAKVTTSPKPGSAPAKVASPADDEDEDEEPTAKPLPGADSEPSTLLNATTVAPSKDELPMDDPMKLEEQTNMFEGDGMMSGGGFGMFGGFGGSPGKSNPSGKATTTVAPSSKASTVTPSSKAPTVAANSKAPTVATTTTTTPPKPQTKQTTTLKPSTTTTPRPIVTTKAQQTEKITTPRVTTESSKKETTTEEDPIVPLVPMDGSTPKPDADQEKADDLAKFADDPSSNFDNMLGGGGGEMSSFMGGMGGVSAF